MNNIKVKTVSITKTEYVVQQKLKRDGGVWRDVHALSQKKDLIDIKNQFCDNDDLIYFYRAIKRTIKEEVME
jgi:hypothetical protein